MGGEVKPEVGGDDGATKNHLSVLSQSLPFQCSPYKFQCLPLPSLPFTHPTCLSLLEGILQRLALSLTNCVSLGKSVLRFGSGDCYLLTCNSLMESRRKEVSDNTQPTKQKKKKIPPHAVRLGWKSSGECTGEQPSFPFKLLSTPGC